MNNRMDPTSRRQLEFVSDGSDAAEDAKQAKEPFGELRRGPPLYGMLVISTETQPCILPRFKSDVLSILHCSPREPVEDSHILLERGTLRWRSGMTY